MGREEIYAALDYWDDEIQRAQFYIHECQENILALKEQMQSQQNEYVE